MDKETYERAEAILAEIRRLINEAADKIEASKEVNKAA